MLIEITAPSAAESALITAWMGIVAGSPGAPRLGFVSNSGVPSDKGGTVNERQIASRRWHAARAPIVAGTPLVYHNFYGPAETGSGSTLTLKVAIEYPAGSGEMHPILFGGQATTTIASGGEAVGLYTGPTIPDGAVFYEFAHAAWAADGILFRWGSPHLEMSQNGLSVTDPTSTGSVAVMGPSFTTYGATAIIGPTYKPSILVLGDSRDEFTYLARSPHAGVTRGFAGLYGYCNLAKAGATMQQFAETSTAKLTQFSAFASTVVIRGPMNDIIGGTTAEQAVSRLAANAAKWGAGKNVIACTTEPHTTSSDGFVTTTNQTVSSGTWNGHRVGYNNAVRGGDIAGIAGYWDIADAAESARDSGLWFVGSGQAHTDDGLHGNPRWFGRLARAVNVGMIS